MVANERMTLPSHRDQAEPIHTVVQGEYRIVRLLGEGELGTIYLAEGLKWRDKLRYALLLLREKLDAFDPQFKAVLSDLRRARTLTDTNLVAIEPVVAPDGMPGFVSEIVPGQRLDRRLREGPLLAADALDIVLGLGKSLVAAHGKQLVHGDLRPANILRVHKDEASPHAGRAVLLWHSLYHLRSQITVDSSAAWLMYRPRQDLVGEGRMASMDTDIFALGAILYECLSGQPAFFGKFEEMVLENLNAPPKPLRARPETGLSSELAASLDSIIGSACAPEPEQRFASMAALVRMLELAKDSAGAALATSVHRTMHRGLSQTLTAWADVVKDDKRPSSATPNADLAKSLASLVARREDAPAPPPTPPTSIGSRPSPAPGAASAIPVIRASGLAERVQSPDTWVPTELLRTTAPHALSEHPVSQGPRRNWRAELAAALAGAGIMLLLAGLLWWLRHR